MGKNCPKWPQNRVFLKNCFISFPGINLKWKLVLLLIFNHQSHIWENSGSRVIGWNVDCQSNCRISRKSEWQGLFLQCRETSKFSTNWYYHFGCVYPDMPKVTPPKKIKRFAYISNISRETWGMKFFCLQINTKVFYEMILFFCVCPKYLNDKCAIFLQYLKKNRKNEIYFLLADKHQRFLWIGTIILDVWSQACPNYPK